MKIGGEKSSYDFFLPMHSLSTTNSAHTSERVNVYLVIRNTDFLIQISKMSIVSISSIE